MRVCSCVFMRKCFYCKIVKECKLFPQRNIMLCRFIVTIFKQTINRLNHWLCTSSKGKPDTPKSPTTPTSPMSPSFSSQGGPLSPRLLTGDSIRDKCIEMLAAALRTDGRSQQMSSWHKWGLSDRQSLSQGHKEILCHMHMVIKCKKLQWNYACFTADLCDCLLCLLMLILL